MRGVSLLGRGGVGGRAQPGATALPRIPEQAVPGEPARGARASHSSAESPAAPNTRRSATQPDVDGKESQSLVPGEARITVDQPTNTIIVIADRAAQQMYEELVTYLDHRPLQVMIEAKVVIIDTSNDFSLGVDLRLRNCDKIGNILTFTQFGVARSIPVSGALSIVPGRGSQFGARESRRRRRYSALYPTTGGPRVTLFATRAGE